MEKFTKSKLVAQIAITSFIAALAIVGVTYATTIGTDISTTGTMGVGTSTPSGTLAIDVDEATSPFVIGSSTSTYLTMDHTGNLTVDTNTLYVSAVNNRVGIGTSTPSFLLSIGADSATSTIGMGKFCMYAQDQHGENVYITLNMAAADASAGIFATSTIDCRQ